MVIKMVSLGDMPIGFKTVIIKPLIKQLALELIKMNFISVSNLASFGKLIVGVVALPIVDLMEAGTDGHLSISIHDLSQNLLH